MLNNPFIYFIYIGIIFSCQHGAYAKPEEDSEKRIDYNERNDSVNFDVDAVSTEEPEAPFDAQMQNRTGVFDGRIDVPTFEMECPNRQKSGNLDVEYTCPNTFCQHLGYGCDVHCPAEESGVSCELNNCMELHHCSSANYYNTPLPHVCNGLDGIDQCPEIDEESTCVEPCPPLCMCIGLTVNFIYTPHVDASFSIKNVSINVNRSHSQFPFVLHWSSIGYLIITDVSTFSDQFFRGLFSLSSLDASNNAMSSLSDNQFSDLLRLVSLNLAHNKLTSIEGSVFTGLSELNSLDLSNNEIVTLSSNLFSSLSALNKLDLSNNKISVLPDGVFNGLSKLLDLNLIHNEIVHITDSVFSELSGLHTLNLYNNMIESIHENAFNAVSGIATLFQNAITVLPHGVFNGPIVLTFLDLSHNKIEVIPDNAFSGLSSLGDLYINDNRIASLPDNVFSGLDGLYALDVSANAIQILPENVFNGLYELNYLYLSSNAIEILSDNVFRQLSRLRQLYLKNNSISVIPENVFNGLYDLEYLYLSENEIQTLSDNVFMGLSNLVKLYLNRNRISVITGNVFNGLHRLALIDLSGNAIQILPDTVFRGLTALSYLLLDYNKITTLSESIFNEVPALNFLDINNNELAVLSADVFSESSGLTYLDLSYNKIKVLPKSVFRGIASPIFLQLDSNEIEVLPTLPLNIRMLDVSNNAIKHFAGTFTNGSTLKLLNIMGSEVEITEHIFEGLDNLSYLITDNPFMCCMKPKSVSDNKCLAISNSDLDCFRSNRPCTLAKGDAISSCSDMISSSVLRVFLWIIGVFALLGNAGVIFYRLFFDRENIKNTYSLFVLNLGVSDFFMGIYLLIIGVADAYYNGVYAWNDQVWRRSMFCTIAGILSFISSEMSTFLILLVTIDRLLVIVLPLSHLSTWRISWIQAIGISVFFWIVSIALALIPIVFFQSYFKGEYYSQAGVCLALPLLGDNQSGAGYSFAVFVYLNSFVFGVIAVGQIVILKTIRAKSKMITSSKNLQRERTVAQTLFLVVATDFCCWCPVGIMGLMSKYGIEISADAYAWVIVFVLPINAAVNPFLYTVTAVWRKRRREQNRASMSSSIRQKRQTETIAMETTAV